MQLHPQVKMVLENQVKKLKNVKEICEKQGKTLPGWIESYITSLTRSIVHDSLARPAAEHLERKVEQLKAGIKNLSNEKEIQEKEKLIKVLEDARKEYLAKEEYGKKILRQAVEAEMVSSTIELKAKPRPQT